MAPPPGPSRSTYLIIVLNGGKRVSIGLASYDIRKKDIMGIIQEASGKDIGYRDSVDPSHENEVERKKRKSMWIWSIIGAIIFLYFFGCSNRRSTDKPLHPNPFTGGIYNDASHLYLTLTHRRPTFTADMITYYCPNMKEPLRPATTGPLNAGISIGQIDLHKQAASTSRQIIAKISKRITANF